MLWLGYYSVWLWHFGWLLIQAQPWLFESRVYKLRRLLGVWDRWKLGIFLDLGGLKYEVIANTEFFSLAKVSLLFRVRIHPLYFKLLPALLLSQIILQIRIVSVFWIWSFDGWILVMVVNKTLLVCLWTDSIDLHARSTWPPLLDLIWHTSDLCVPASHVQTLILEHDYSLVDHVHLLLWLDLAHLLPLVRRLTLHYPNLITITSGHLRKALVSA